MGLLLVGAGKVEAQCSGYSSSAPTKTILTPSQAAAQGGMTVTLDVGATDYSQQSHKLTVGDGTIVRFNYTNNNISSSALYWAWNGGSQAYWFSPSDNNSGTWTWSTQGQAGNTIRIYLVGTSASGQTTQDVVTITVTNQAPGIYIADFLPTNFYAQMGSSFQGPSMLNSCTLCQNQPYKCINKMHHPKQHWQVTNNSTGEYHDAGWTYGNAACENCAVSYGGTSPFISLNPGDSLSFNVENTVICDEFGVIYDNNGGDTFSWDTEYAFTTEATIGSMCQLLDEGIQADGTTHTGIECPISYFCKKGSAPPDFDPAYLASDRNCAVPNHCTESDIPVFPPYWLMGGFGVRFEIFGVWSPWQFPFYDAAGFVIGLRKKSDFINALFSIGNVALPSPFGANAISCTNSALGTGPITWP